MSIHKSLALANYTAGRTGKNVYEMQRTDNPYTTDISSAAQRAGSPCITDLRSVRSEPITFTLRGSCSAPGAPALSPGPCTARAAAAERRDRLADPVSSEESERECIGDVWRMYREYMENAWRMHGWCNICIRSMNITPDSSNSRF